MIYNYLKTVHSKIFDHTWIGGWEDKDDVILFRRDEDGNRVTYRIPNVPRYFCVRKSDLSKIGKSVLTIWKEQGLIKSGRMIGEYAYFVSNYIGNKNYWNSFLKKLHDMGVEPLEADISRLQRVFIDLGLKVTSPNSECAPKICFWDIETYDGGDEIRIGKDRILSVAIKDKDREIFLSYDRDSDDAEREFIQSVYDTLTNYDVIISFNGFGFDEPYLEGRMEYYNINADKWRRICKIDLYNQYERQQTFLEFKTKDRKLNTIALAVIGEGKIEHSEKIHELWSNNKQKLEEYNLQDIRLLAKMEDKLKTANLVMEMMSLSNIPYNISHSPLRLVESFLLNRAREKREAGILDYRFGTSYYLPEHNLNNGKSAWSRNSLAADNRKGRAEKLAEMGIEYEKIEGGYVMESEPAYVHDVVSFDFNSLYPSIMIAFNVCWSTLLTEQEKNDITIPKNYLPNGSAFRTDMVGLMPDSVEYLLNKRKSIRAEMKNETDKSILSALDVRQKSVKILANSFYGVSGLWGSRLYSSEIGNAITSFGRYALPLGYEYFTSMDRKVLVQDTDSMYVAIKEGDDPIALMNGYVEEMRRATKEKYNVYRPEVLKMGYEKYFTSLLVAKKKMYAGYVKIQDGVVLDEEKLIIKGFKIIKSDTVQWASEVAKRILEDVLRHKYTYDHFMRILKEERQKLVDGKIPLDKLKISRRLGKDIDDYDSDNLVYVTIADRMKKSGYQITSHQTINFYITDGVTPMNGVSEEEANDAKSVELDLVYYWNNGLLKIIVPILEIAFPEVDWNELKFPKKIKKYDFFELKYRYIL